MPEPDPSTLVVAAGEERGHSWISGGFGVIFKVFGTETGGRLAIVEHPIWPRMMVMPHVHEREDEYSFVLVGTIGARIGDREIEASAGSYVLKPRQVPHAFWNPTDQPARILEMISPAGFENFFDELGQLVTSFDGQGDRIAPADRAARVGELAAGYGLRYLPEWIPELEAKYGLHTRATQLRS